MNKVSLAVALAGSILLLAGCSDDDDPVVTTTSTSSCATNVDGCPDAGQFSCAAAEFCYTSQAECVQSNECPAAGGTTGGTIGGTTGTTTGGTQTAGSCSTNVEGCPAASFSCAAATFCYDSQAECAQSLECP